MKSVIYLLICFLFLISGYSCSNHLNEETVDPPEETVDPPEEEVYPPLPPPNYIYAISFKDTYFKFIQRDDVYLVKGIALDVYEYGRKIEVIEDLKGNFDDRSSIFVWGGGTASEESGFARLETDRTSPLITWYNDNDTLIIFMEKAGNDDEEFIEKVGDYGTLTNSNSILEYSNGLVTGVIIKRLSEETLQWDELVQAWQTFLHKNERPSWWWSVKLLTPVPFVYSINTVFTGDDDFFIKGLVLEEYHEYGKRIQVLCDLKGNFDRDISTINVWGEKKSEDISYSDPSIFRRVDDLRNYNDGDTLIMCLNSIPYLYNSGKPYDDKSSLEKSGDYYTSYDYAVLKLSNDSVKGCITSFYWEEETMSFENFKQLINVITIKNL